MFPWTPRPFFEKASLNRCAASNRLGVDLETIQNIAGHAEIDMTRHYLHVQEPRRLDAAQRFSDAFSKKGRGTFGNILDYVKSS